MKKKENQIEFSRNSIVRNLFYNLFGYGLPVLCAIFFIPPLITKLGNLEYLHYLGLLLDILVFLTWG